MASIHFFNEDCVFKLKNKQETTRWIKDVINLEGFSLGYLNYIFCSDSHLLSLNQTYLRHNTLTDVITFDNSSGVRIIEAEIYISVERIKENAIIFKVDFLEELHRIMIHGVLHLIGYGDKGRSQKVKMREKEERYLSLYT